MQRTPARQGVEYVVAAGHNFYIHSGWDLPVPPFRLAFNLAAAAAIYNAVLVAAVLPLLFRLSSRTPEAA